MKAADKGPVFITDNGRQTYVLLTIDEYRKITGKKESILDLLAMPEMAEIDDDFEFPRMGDELFRPIYLS
jgi:prevent-host-death family protein